MSKKTDGIVVLQMPAFKRSYKKLHATAKLHTDEAIRTIIADASVGQIKKGDLAGIRVYKFKIQQQEYLLAYRESNTHRILMALGAHENFYRDLKQK